MLWRKNSFRYKVSDSMFHVSCSKFNLQIVIFLASLMGVQCATKNVSVEGNLPTRDSVPRAESAMVEIYRSELMSLPFFEESSLKGQLIFSESMDKKDSSNNDLAFKIYLEFQAKLIDTLNNRLYRRSDIEIISSLIWADTTLHEKQARDYERSLNANGLVLGSTEGMIFIDRDMTPIKIHFYQYLSPSTQRLFLQFDQETRIAFSNDGGITISLIELADRLSFWDKFLHDYPQHIFAEFAKNKVDGYLYFLMRGMDNTPAYQDDGKISKEFLDACQYFVKKYPAVPSSTIVHKYLELLAESNYKTSSKIDEFINRYPPH
jgi:hypothetical protein